MYPNQAKSKGIYKDRAMDPGVIGILIEIQDRYCLDIFIIKHFLLISIWEVFKNTSAS